MIEVFDENSLYPILEANDLTVVFFCASWCPYCQSFLPFFERAATSSDQRKFIIVNMDDFSNPLWERFDIEAVPTLICFKKIEIHDRIDGRLGRGIKEKEFSDWMSRI